MNLNLRQISGNALSILTSDVMNRATSFVLYALVARHLGARQFGQLALALTLFYTFQVFAIGGLKTLIIRQVAKDRSQTSAYFLNCCMIVMLSSTVSIAALLGFVRLMHYLPETTLVISLLSLGLIPYTLSAVCEGIFQAWEQMRYIAYVNVPVNIAKIGAAYWLLTGNRGLYAVVLILLCSFVAIAIIELGIVLRRFPSRHASIDLSFALATARSAVTFLGIDATIAVMNGLNILFLSKLTSEVEVGLYSAASQLMVPLLLVYQSLSQSIFPVMCRRAQTSFQSLKNLANKALEFLLVLALPAATGLYFFGDRALSLLYRNPAFRQAFPVLRIIAWVLIFQGFTSILGQVLMAIHREKVNLRIVVVDILFNLLVGWPLIAYFGLRGAALTLLMTRFVDCIQHYLPVWKLFSGIPLLKITWKPLLAAGCMMGFLAIPAIQAGLLTGISAMLVYGSALIALTIWASGGPRQFKENILPLFS